MFYDVFTMKVRRINRIRKLLSMISLNCIPSVSNPILVGMSLEEIYRDRERHKDIQGK